MRQPDNSKPRQPLDYETKNAYTVTITVSDGSLTDTITVTINVTDINEEGGDDPTPQPDPPEQPRNTGGTPILSVSTAAPLTEATLHEGIVTLTLTDGTYESSSWRIRDAVTAFGISGVTVDPFDVDRVSDTEVTVELTYDGNMSANGTLTISVGAGAIQDYDGSALTAEISVSASIDVAEGDLFFLWTDDDTDKIRRANLDGSNVQILVTGLGVPYGIALDVVGGKMYWTDIGRDKIQRANLDGSHIEDLVTQGLWAPGGLALDVVGGKMYWTDWGTDKIQRANLDGSHIEDLVTQGLIGPSGLALDVVGGKMYWTDWGHR